MAKDKIFGLFEVTNPNPRSYTFNKHTGDVIVLPDGKKKKDTNSAKHCSDGDKVEKPRN